MSDQRVTADPIVRAPFPDAPGLLSPEAADVLLRWLVAGVANSAPSDPATQEAIQYVITGRAERRLAALPPRDALGVEPLARALHEVYCHRNAPMHSERLHSAAAIAREYAAQSEETSDV